MHFLFGTRDNEYEKIVCAVLRDFKHWKMSVVELITLHQCVFTVTFQKSLRIKILLMIR